MHWGYPIPWNSLWDGPCNDGLQYINLRPWFEESFHHQSIEIDQSIRDSLRETDTADSSWRYQPQTCRYLPFKLSEGRLSLAARREGYREAYRWFGSKVEPMEWPQIDHLKSIVIRPWCLWCFDWIDGQRNHLRSTPRIWLILSKISVEASLRRMTGVHGSIQRMIPDRLDERSHMKIAPLVFLIHL